MRENHNTNQITHKLFLSAIRMRMSLLYLSLCLTNEALCYEVEWESARIHLHTIDLSTTPGWMVNFTPQPLYPKEDNPRYPLDNRLGGPRTGLDNMKKRKISSLPGLKLWPLGNPAHCRSQWTFGFHEKWQISWKTDPNITFLRKILLHVVS
jgi:hypothetical protein